MSESTLYVGIDVSCDKLDVAFVDDDERPVRHQAVYPNDPEGWTALRAAIIGAAPLLGADVHVVCGMESTGNMHRRAEEALRTETRRKLEVHVLNPRAVKHYAKARLRDTKTDRIDARMIAFFLRSMRPPEGAELPEEFGIMREATRTRRSYIEDRTQEKNRLRTHMRYFFPGYRKVFPRLTKGFLTALKAYPTPERIIEAGVEDIAALSMGRRRVGEATARKLVELAEQVPSAATHRTVELAIRNAARSILALDAQLAEMDEAIAELVESVFPDSPLHTVPGLGPVSVAAILAEVGDIGRFTSKRNFVGYSGLYPIRIQSGRSDYVWKMTYKGNRMLKMTLLLASVAARQHNPIISALYERLRARGKSTKAAGGAVARKLAELVYTLLSRNEPWDADKARRGILRSAEMAEEVLDG